MARNERRRVKKLEKKRTERKNQHVQAARIQSAGTAVRMAAASSWPLLGAHETDNGGGIVSCWLARRGPRGAVALSNFLVDIYCLGVKDSFSKITNNDEYARFLERQNEVGAVDVSPARLRKLVEGAVAYAKTLGLEPHAEYASATMLFGDIDATECTEDIEFGCNGQPLFIPGPYDSPAFCHRVLASMNRMNPGSGDVLGFGDDDFDDDDLDDVDDQFDGEIEVSEITFEEPDDAIEVSARRVNG